MLPSFVDTELLLPPNHAMQVPPDIYEQVDKQQARNKIHETGELVCQVIDLESSIYNAKLKYRRKTRQEFFPHKFFILFVCFFIKKKAVIIDAETVATTFRKEINIH